MKFYMQMDTQFEYREGEELYHVFERGRVNEWGEPYCVSPFLTFESAQDLIEELSTSATNEATQ